MMGTPVQKLLNVGDNSSPLMRIVPQLPNTELVDERVDLYPSIGIPLSGGDVWRILVQGRIAQSAPATFSKRLMLRGLVSALDLSKEMASSPLFGERVEGFLTSPIPGQRVQIELAGQHYVLKGKSKGSGLFSCKLDLPASQLAAFRAYGKAEPSARWRSSVGPPPPAVALNERDSVPIFLAHRQGVSVVTDIDDTVKLTEVNARKRMLQRTFAEPFEPIEGMADAYRSWEEQGALFHYVSSSPWQIYRPLERFLCEGGFPLGSMHLKWFRLRDEIFKGWRLLRRKSKGGVIRGLMKRMPERTFVLVGDSGERDPEIYAKLASKFPTQVVRICIRQIEAKPLDCKRLDAIYARHGMVVPIQVFSTPQQLGDLLAWQ